MMDTDIPPNKEPPMRNTRSLTTAVLLATLALLPSASCRGSVHVKKTTVNRKRPPRPGPRHHWVSGHKNRHGVWVPGHWRK